MARAEHDVTQLLAAVRADEPGAREQLFEVVYSELRQIARRARFAGRDGETMQPTVLANEAYMALTRRLQAGALRETPDRKEFFRVAALAIRTILRDYWRKRTAQKRGGEANAQRLGDLEPADDAGADQLDYLALDEAMRRLEVYHPRWHAVVMYRHFAGRTLEETADLLDVALSTVKSDWNLARGWLRRELDKEVE